MAISSSFTFISPIRRLWKFVVGLVADSEYAMVETDDKARKLVYHSRAGFFTPAYEIRVSLTELDDEETQVTVIVTPLANSADSSQQGHLDFIFCELKERYEVIKRKIKRRWQNPSELDADEDPTNPVALILFLVFGCMALLLFFAVVLKR